MSRHESSGRTRFGFLILLNPTFISTLMYPILQHSFSGSSFFVIVVKLSVVKTMTLT